MPESKVKHPAEAIVFLNHSEPNTETQTQHIPNLKMSPPRCQIIFKLQIGDATPWSMPAIVRLYSEIAQALHIFGSPVHDLDGRAWRSGDPQQSGWSGEKLRTHDWQTILPQLNYISCIAMYCINTFVFKQAVSKLGYPHRL